MKPNPWGPWMPQGEKATGMCPAAAREALATLTVDAG